MSKTSAWTTPHMIDLEDWWTWSWRDTDREAPPRIDRRRAALVGTGLAASIVVPLVIVNLHADRAVLDWLSGVL